MVTQLRKLLSDKRDRIRAGIIEIQKTHTHESNYQLHSREIDRLADGEIESLVRYLEQTNRSDGQNRSGWDRRARDRSDGRDGSDSGAPPDGVDLSADTDCSAGVEWGQQLAAKGIGVRSLLETASLLRSELATDRPATLKLIEPYLNARSEAYQQALLHSTLKDQEQTRRALSDALRQQSRELVVKNHAIDTSRDGILMTDLKGSITYVNPAFSRMWGYDTTELLHTPAGQIVSQFTGVEFPPSDEDGLPQGLMAGTRKEGEVFDAEVTTSLIRDRSGQPAGLMAAFRDVTERTRLEAQIRRAQKMDALGQLAGGIVHDFNNLLTAISGYTQLLLMDADPEGQHAEDYRQIKMATDQAKALTDQLRVFTRDMSGTKAHIDLNKNIEETVSLLRRTFPREVTIRTRLAETPWPIEADRSQMSQLVMNLCVNARDAMLQTDPPGGTLTISTANIILDNGQAARHIGARPGRYIRLRTRDTGVGIEPEVIDRLFEPFFTTKGETGGTGLGLAIVYGIVNNHSGFVDVHSSPGRGSTFDIYFPATEAALEDTSQPRDRRALVRGTGLILVVDDEDSIRTIATRTLTRCGYTTLQAADGAEAVQMYQEHGGKIDLVVLDMVMPRMGGPRCYEQLMRINPRVRVLCITGFTTNNTFQQFMRKGCSKVLEKPLDLQAFARAVKQALEDESY
jgi:PAS domain S-box-containing protein